MLKTAYIVILLTAFSSCKTDYSFQKLTEQKVKFAKKSVESSELGYSLVVPMKWTLADSQYDENISVETYADTSDGDGVFSMLTVIKYKGGSNTLALERERLQNSPNQLKGVKMVDSGSTSFLKFESYFDHYKSNTGIENEAEAVTFLLKAHEDSIFYSIAASAPQNRDLLTEMGMLLSCVKQFDLH